MRDDGIQIMEPNEEHRVIMHFLSGDAADTIPRDRIGPIPGRDCDPTRIELDIPRRDPTDRNPK